MTLKNKAIELASYIKKTKEFDRLKKATLELKKKPSLKNKVEEFNKRQFEIFKIKDRREAEIKAKRLNSEYQGLLSHPEVEQFIKTGREFNLLLSGVYKVINKSIDESI